MSIRKKHHFVLGREILEDGPSVNPLIHTRLDFTAPQYLVGVKTRTPDEDEILPLGAGESN